MATTYETSSTAKSGGRDYDMSLWYDSRWYKFGLITMLAVAIFWVWYQRTFAYSHGMDSMEPEFEKVWMGYCLDGNSNSTGVLRQPSWRTDFPSPNFLTWVIFADSLYRVVGM